MVIFHSYVNLPEGKKRNHPKMTEHDRTIQASEIWSFTQTMGGLTTRNP